MRVINRLTACIVILYIYGCTNDYSVYHIEGAGSGFCVPKRFEINDSYLGTATFLRADGFAFIGCAESLSDTDDSCIIPEHFDLRGVVGPNRKFKGWGWEDFGQDAFYKRVANDLMAEYEAYDSGSLLLVKNKAMTKYFFLWKKGDPLHGEGKPFLADGDELLAVCEADIFNSCRRIIRTPEYYISYSFKYSGDLPNNLYGIDSMVIDQISKWRCEE